MDLLVLPLVNVGRGVESWKEGRERDTQPAVHDKITALGAFEAPNEPRNKRLVCILIFTAACKSFTDGPTLGKTHILNKGVGISCVRLLYFGTTSHMGPLRLLRS